MRKFIDTTGAIQFLLEGEEIPNGWTELVEKYKRYRAANGDIHTVLADMLPEDDWVEEDIDFLGQPDPLYVPPYTAMRVMNYPHITEQLDMLWHELNNNGSISTSGSWFQSIQEIKNQFPKE